MRPPSPDPTRVGTAADGVFVAIAAGAVLLVIWPLAAVPAIGGPVASVPMVAHVCGMLAGYGVVVLVALMSRWPWLEDSVGSDRLARWHGRGGRIVLVLVLVHAWAASLAWAQSRDEGIATALRDVIMLPGLLSATVATVILVVVGTISVRAARRRLRYEVWHGIHLLTYVAVALSFAHQLAGPDLVGHRLLQVGWALLYCHVFALVLQYRVVTPVRAATRHRLRVSAVVEEIPGVVSILLEGQHLDQLMATSGQFFRWRFLTPDTWSTAHPFSLSAAPTDTHLRLTVKNLGDGSRLLQSIEAGTWVIAEGPYGVMTAARRTQRHVLLIAGGVGITPMRALFETLPIAPGQDLLLLYRARDESTLVFRSELDAIATRRGARVEYLLGDDRHPLTAVGLRERFPDLAHYDVYLCGPPGLSGDVRIALERAGLPEDQLYEERFGF